jgi:hypothetical protein
MSAVLTPFTQAQARAPAAPQIGHQLDVALEPNRNLGSHWVRIPANERD